MKKYIWKILFTFGLLTSLSYNLFLYQKIKSSQQERIVDDVLDGDTFIFANDQRIRLLNVNAPELSNCGGEEAKNRLKELVLGKFISYDESVVDKFGRLVASVYVDDVYVNEIMLKEGWGYFENRKTAEYDKLKQAADESKQNMIGIYSSQCYQKENSGNSKCLIKGNNAWDSDKKIYHFPGCSGYAGILVEKFIGDEWFCDEEEAIKAGYQKSENCYDKIYKPR